MSNKIKFDLLSLIEAIDKIALYSQDFLMLMIFTMTKRALMHQ